MKSWRLIGLLGGAACIGFTVIGLIVPPTPDTITPVMVASETPTTMPTDIPTATPTATITSTPTPEDTARAAFESSLFRGRELLAVVVNERVVTLRFPLTDLSAGAALQEGERGFVLLACQLRAAGLTGRDYQFTGIISLVDAAGNRTSAEGVAVTLGAAAVDAMNCIEPHLVDPMVLSEQFVIHPALQ